MMTRPLVASRNFVPDLLTLTFFSEGLFLLPPNIESSHPIELPPLLILEDMSNARAKLPLPDRFFSISADPPQDSGQLERFVSPRRGAPYLISVDNIVNTLAS